MAIDARAAAAIIVESANEATAEKAAMEGLAAPQALAVSPGAFCDIWKTAKPALNAAATILAFIAPRIAGVLRGLIKIGDQLAAELCN